jgi:hypothetical protein
MSGRAADVWAGLAADHPDTADYHGELGIALGNQGRALEPADPGRARQLLTRGVAEVLAGLKASPNDPAFQDSLRKQSLVLGRLLAGAGDHDGAQRMARDIASALPDRPAAVHRAVALLAACAAATQRQNGPDADQKIERYAALAAELVTAAGPADWSALAADPDCKPLVARPALARAIGK